MLCSVSISKGLIRASFWDHKFSYWAITLAAIHDASLMFDSAPAESIPRPPNPILQLLNDIIPPLILCIPQYTSTELSPKDYSFC
jgi:hypothetical protein